MMDRLVCVNKEYAANDAQQKPETGEYGMLFVAV